MTPLDKNSWKKFLECGCGADEFLTNPEVAIAAPPVQPQVIDLTPVITPVVEQDSTSIGPVPESPIRKPVEIGAK